ncbi:MAG: acyltransferase [Spirosomataceae bacterium]
MNASVLDKQKTSSYLIQLDGLRFIAIALVLVDHFTAAINKIPMGPLGVNLFFVLSGFLITRILINSREKFKNNPQGFKGYFRRFFIRRSLRIFPVYYLCIFLLFVFNVPPVREKLPWFLTYTSNIYMAINQTWMGVVDHFWSLSVEEQFYILFPLVIFFTPKRWFVTVFISMLIISLLFRAYFFFAGYSWIVNYVSMPACLDSFGLGALMAWLLLFRPHLYSRIFRNSIGVIAGLLLWIVVVYWSKSFDQPKNFATDVVERLAGSIFCFFLIGKGVLGYQGWMKLFLENRVVLYLGKISYGLYAYHNLVYNHYHSPPTHPTLRVLRKIETYLPAMANNLLLESLYFFTITVAVASLSWYIMEKPINALKDKWT